MILWSIACHPDIVDVNSTSLSCLAKERASWQLTPLLAAFFPQCQDTTLVPTINWYSYITTVGSLRPNQSSSGVHQSKLKNSRPPVSRSQFKMATRCHVYITCQNPRLPGVKPYTLHPNINSKVTLKE